MHPGAIQQSGGKAPRSISQDNAQAKKRALCGQSAL